jgi:hypothetical protein
MGPQQHLNLFSKGMNHDSHPSLVKPDEYISAWNAVQISTTNSSIFEISNEPGFINAVENEMPINFIVLGMCPIQDDIVVLGISFTNGFNNFGPFNENIIGILIKQENGLYFYQEVLNDNNPLYWVNDNVIQEQRLNFDIRYQIQVTARISFDNERVIYWTDGLNPPRTLNITKDYTLEENRFRNLAEQVQLFDVYQRPYIKYNGFSGGGAIKPGVYQFAARYLNKTFDPTGFGYISNPIPVTAKFRQDTRDQYIGGPYDHPVVSKTINLTVHNVDQDYDYIEVACVYYTDAGSVPNIRLIGRYPIRASLLEIQFTGDFMNETPLSVMDLVRPPVVYSSAKHLLAKDGRLFLANLKRSPLINLQELANNIRIRAVFRDIPINNNDPNYFGDYKEENNTFEYKSYRRDEVYSFGIVGIFRDGNETLVHHIPGVFLDATLDEIPEFADNFNYLAPWHYIAPYQSEILYDEPPVVPDNYFNVVNPRTNERVNLTGLNIRHHRMPSNDYQPFYYRDALNNPFIRILGVQLEGIQEFLSRPENAELQRNLVQIILVRQQRNSIENKSIYGQGLCHGFLYQEGRFQVAGARDTEFNTTYHTLTGEDRLIFYRYRGIDSLDFPEVEVGTYKELKEFLLNDADNPTHNNRGDGPYIPYEKSDATGVVGLPILHIQDLKIDYQDKNILPCLILDPFNRNTRIFFQNVIPYGGLFSAWDYDAQLTGFPQVRIDDFTGLPFIKEYAGFFCPELVFDKAFFIPSGTARLKTISLLTTRPRRHINGLKEEYALFHNGSYSTSKDHPYNAVFRAPYHHLIFDFTEQAAYNTNGAFSNFSNYNLYLDILSSQKTLWNEAVLNNAGITKLVNKLPNVFYNNVLNNRVLRGGNQIRINNYESESYFVFRLTGDFKFYPALNNIDNVFKYLIYVGGAGVLYYIPIMPAFSRELLSNTIDIISGDEIGGIVGSINSIAAYRQIRSEQSFRGVFTGRYAVLSRKRQRLEELLDLISFGKSVNEINGDFDRIKIRKIREALNFDINRNFNAYVPEEFESELYADNDFYVLPIRTELLRLNNNNNFSGSLDFLFNDVAQLNIRSIFHRRHFFTNPVQPRNNEPVLPRNSWDLSTNEIQNELPNESKYLFNLELVNTKQYGYLNTNEYIQVEVLFSERTIQENATFNATPNQFIRDEQLKSYERSNITDPIFNGDTFITRFAYRASCNIPCAYGNLKYTEGMKNAFQKSFGLPSMAKIPLLNGGVNMFYRDLAIGARNLPRYVMDENGRIRKDIRVPQNNDPHLGINRWLIEFIIDNSYQDVKLAFTEYVDLVDPVNASKKGINLRSLNIFYCESSFNLEYRHRPLDFTSTETTSRGRGNQFNAVRDLQNVREGVPFYPYNSLDEVFLVTPEFNHSDGYNFQYSFENSLKKYYCRKFGEVYVNEFPTRTIYSEPIDQTTLYGKPDKSELSDKWKQFLPLNFQDLPKLKGEITNLFEHNKFLYIHTEKTLYRAFVNNNTIMQDKDGFGLFMGNKSVFSQEPEEIFSLEGGYVGCLHKYSGVNTPYGYIFWDENSKKLFQFTDSLEEISKNGMYKWFFEVPDIYRTPPPDGWNDPDSPVYNPNYFNNPANPLARGINAFYDPMHNRYVIGFKKGQNPIEMVQVGTQVLPLPNPNFINFIDPQGNFNLEGTAIDRDPGPNGSNAITPLRFFNIENLQPGTANCFNLNVTSNPDGECFLINTPGVYTLEYDLNYLATVCYRWLNTNCVSVTGFVQLEISYPEENQGIVTATLTNYAFQLLEEPVPCQMPPGVDWVCVPPLDPNNLPWNNAQNINNQLQITVTQAMIDQGLNNICFRSLALLAANLTCIDCDATQPDTYSYNNSPTVSSTAASDIPNDFTVPVEPDSNTQTDLVTPNSTGNQNFSTITNDCIYINVPGTYEINITNLMPLIRYEIDKVCFCQFSAEFTTEIFLRLPPNLNNAILIYQDQRNINGSNCNDNVIIHSNVPGPDVDALFTVNPYNNTVVVTITPAMISSGNNRICLEFTITANTIYGNVYSYLNNCPNQNVPRVLIARNILNFTGDITITPIVDRYVEVKAQDFLIGNISICAPLIEAPIFQTTIQEAEYDTISYNLLSKTFTSFHSYFPAISVTNHRFVFSSPNLLILNFIVYLHNIRNYELERELSGRYGVFYNQIGEPSNFIVEFVVNKDPFVSKIFGNLFVIAQVIDEQIEQGIIQYRDFFNTIECWTDSQSTGVVPINIYPFDGDELTTNCKLYKQQYQIQLPLAANTFTPNDVIASQIERLQPLNIYDPLFINQNLENKPRLKGKYLIVRFLYNNTTFEIPQINLPPRTRNFNFILKSVISKYNILNR